MIDKDKNDVLKFIEDYWGVKRIQTYSLNTSLSDIGFFGDDKKEFLISFFKNFKIDYSNFNFEEYVEPESNFFRPVSFLTSLFHKKMIKNEFKEITFNDLIKSLENKKWI